jgi:hypothetical protein
MAFDYTQVDGLTDQRALVLPYVLPVLIRRAKEGRLITYTELAQEIEDEYGISPLVGRMTWWGWPVGTVGFMVRDWGAQNGLTVPPINVIVVSKTTRRPGAGADHVAAYYKIDGIDMERNRSAYMDAAAEAVFNYGKRNWDEVAKAAGAKALPTQRKEIQGVARISLPSIPAKFVGESAAHKALKIWAVQNPSIFREYGKFTIGENEKVLSSGDRLDAHFSNGTERLAVEVKPRSSTEDELKRGVYQCIKYQAVMRAENQSLGVAPVVSAVLVCTRRPGTEVRNLMKRLHVEFVLAPKRAEEH